MIEPRTSHLRVEHNATTVVNYHIMCLLSIHKLSVVLPGYLLMNLLLYCWTPEWKHFSVVWEIGLFFMFNKYLPYCWKMPHTICCAWYCLSLSVAKCSVVKIKEEYTKILFLWIHGKYLNLKFYTILVIMKNLLELAVLDCRVSLWCSVLVINTCNIIVLWQLYILSIVLKVLLQLKCFCCTVIMCKRWYFVINVFVCYAFLWLMNQFWYLISF